MPNMDIMCLGEISKEFGLFFYENIWSHTNKLADQPVWVV
jgi:hypothetical protein